MKYNFDKIIDRKDTGSWKWDTTELIFGSDDVLPMWVADMDFPVAKPIIDALKKRKCSCRSSTTKIQLEDRSRVDRIYSRRYSSNIQRNQGLYPPGR